MVLNLIICFLTVLVIALLRDIISLEINKRRTGMSFRESIYSIGLPVVTMTSGDQELNFLVDSGSNLSHINLESLALIKDYEKVGNSRGFVSASSCSDETSEIVNIPLQYKKQSYSEDFTVLNLQEAFDDIEKDFGIRIHGILGTSFFTKYRYVLDFEDLIAYIK